MRGITELIDKIILRASTDRRCWLISEESAAKSVTVTNARVLGALDDSRRRTKGKRIRTTHDGRFAMYREVEIRIRRRAQRERPALWGWMHSPLHVGRSCCESKIVRSPWIPRAHFLLWDDCTEIAKLSLFSRAKTQNRY